MTVFVAGHFGEWLQGRAGPAGEVVLVTLACPVRGVSVTVEHSEAAPGLTVDDPSGLLDPGRAARLVQALGVRGLSAGRRITVRPDCPPGGGAGMSTAALVALARAAGADEERIAAACLAVEGASDPLMMARPDGVLWAPRRARMLATMPSPPAADIIGGFFGPPQRTDPADTDFPVIDDLIAHWQAAPDLAGAARLSAESARRTTALRGPADDPTPHLAEAFGALGWARAHTGSARALVFPPGGVPEGLAAALAAAGLVQVTRFATGGRDGGEGRWTRP
jgi:hypothetical protein